MKEEICENSNGQEGEASQLPAIPSPNSDFITLEDVPECQPSWLWPPFIVGNGITVLDGRPGCNKTTLAATVVAHVTAAGDSYTVGTLSGGAIYISGEDDPASVLRPRIEAAGGDLSRVRIYDAANAVDSFILPDMVGRLEAECKGIDAKIVVIDPLSAFMSGSTASERSVRRALTPLRNMAQRCGVAVLILRHVNKSPSKDLLNAGSGSNSISAIARSVLVLSRPGDNRNLRVLEQIKCSTVQENSTRAFAVDDDGYGHPVISWNSISEQEAEAMANECQKRRAHPEKLEEAIEFLGDLLEHRSQPAGVIRSLARSMDISMPTLNRAKSALHVHAEKDGFCGGWSWYLPQKRAESTGADAEDDQVDGAADGDHLRDTDSVVSPETHVDSVGCDDEHQDGHPVPDAEGDHRAVDDHLGGDPVGDNSDSPAESTGYCAAAEDDHREGARGDRLGTPLDDTCVEPYEQVHNVALQSSL